VAYIEGDVPILGLSHFVCAHVLREEPYHSISMLYEGGNKVLRLPNQAYLLCSCDQLIVQLNTLENACRSILGPPHTHGRAQWEAAGQSPSQPQWDTGYGSGLLGYQEGGSSYYPHGTLGQAMEPEPPSLLSSPTGTTPSRGISVTWWTKQNARWRGTDGSKVGWTSSSVCRQRYTRPLTRRPTCCTTSSTTSTSTLMLKSCKDLILGEEPTG
jgi:hypothetical protein